MKMGDPASHCHVLAGWPDTGAPGGLVECTQTSRRPLPLTTCRCLLISQGRAVCPCSLLSAQGIAHAHGEAPSRIIFLCRLDGQTGALQGVWYNAHRARDGAWLPAGVADREASTGRPRMYVALHGHGTYPRPASFMRAFFMANDRCSNAGVVWRPDTCVILPAAPPEQGLSGAITWILLILPAGPPELDFDEMSCAPERGLQQGRVESLPAAFVEQGGWLRHSSEGLLIEVQIRCSDTAEGRCL